VMNDAISVASIPRLIELKPIRLSNTSPVADNRAVVASVNESSAAPLDTPRGGGRI
jgi:hypothetical protein